MTTFAHFTNHSETICCARSPMVAGAIRGIWFLPGNVSQQQPSVVGHAAVVLPRGGRRGRSSAAADVVRSTVAREVCFGASVARTRRAEDGVSPRVPSRGYIISSGLLIPSRSSRHTARPFGENSDFAQAIFSAECVRTRKKSSSGRAISRWKIPDRTFRDLGADHILSHHNTSPIDGFTRRSVSSRSLEVAPTTTTRDQTRASRALVSGSRCSQRRRLARRRRPARRPPSRGPSPDLAA